MTAAEKMVWAAAFASVMEEKLRGTDGFHAVQVQRALRVAALAVEAFRSATTLVDANGAIRIPLDLSIDEQRAWFERNGKTVGMLGQMIAPTEEG